MTADHMTQDLYHDPYEAPHWATGAWQARLTDALSDYAAAVTAELASRGVRGVDRDCGAGQDVAWIELTIADLADPRGPRAGEILDATVCFCDALGWHYHRCGGEWACLTPVTAGTTPTELTPPPGQVAQAIAEVLLGAAHWPARVRDGLLVTGHLDGVPGNGVLAEDYLDELIEALERHCPVLAA